MPALTFQNTAYFGDLIRFLRDDVLNQARTAVNAHGGPSVSLQNDIETGKDIPITEETLGKYSDAFDMLAPGNNFISLFEALGAGMLHINGIGTAVHTRRHEITDTLATWYKADQIYLGVDIKTGENVSAHALAYPTEGEPNLVRALADRRGSAACITPLLTLALRHPAITLIPQSQQQVTRAALAAVADPTHPGTVHTNPERNFDPLTGVTSLYQARQRAQALGADPDSSATAWIILIANAIGAERRNTPLLSWIRYRSSTSPWVKQISGLSEPLRAGLPSIENMLSESEKTLAPWARLYGDSLWDVEFTAQTDEQIEWSIREVARPPAPVPRPDDIWIYDATATNQCFGHVLHDSGVPNIIFAADQLGIVHSGAGFQPEHVLFWCPLGPADDFALVYNKKSSQPRWRAVQLA